MIGSSGGEMGAARIELSLIILSVKMVNSSRFLGSRCVSIQQLRKACFIYLVGRSNNLRTIVNC